MKYIALNSGDKMPIVGLGTWKSDKNDVKKAVKMALDAGYKHIDCAAIYGNEEQVGEALSEAMRNGLEREDLWITSKLWNNAHKREDVRPALEKTLKDLQLEYLDLYLIHWPVAFKPDVDGFPDGSDGYLSLAEVPLTETWAAMEECVDAGLVRNIGVSNFGRKALDLIIREGRIHPAVNQIELHPYLQQDSMVEYCHNKNVAVTGYSPLGSADRSDDMKREDEPVVLEDEVLKEIADQKDSGVGQIALAWNIARDVIVIPKSTSEDHIKENLASADIDLTAEQRQQIRRIDKGYRLVTGNFFSAEGNNYSCSTIYEGEYCP